MRKKLTPLPNLCPSQQRSCILRLSRLDGVDPARRAKVFIWRNVGPASRVTLPYRKKASRLTGSPFQPSQLFVSHINGSPNFVRKCKKNWLAQGSLDRRVTLLNGALFYLFWNCPKTRSAYHLNGIFGSFFWTNGTALFRTKETELIEPYHLMENFGCQWTGVWVRINKKHDG